METVICKGKDTIEFKQQLITERLQLITSQAKSTCALVLLSLIGLAVLLQQQLSALLMTLILSVACTYIIRTLLASQISVRQISSLENFWVSAFVISVATSGILWGTIAAVLINSELSGVSLIVVFLIGAYAAGAVPNLGALFHIYFFYSLGILLPVSISFYLYGGDLGPVLAGLSVVFAIHLNISAYRFRNRLDHSLQTSLENKILAEHLKSEKNLSEQARIDAEKNRITLSNLLGNLPGMAYRAINDGNWTFEFLSDGCMDIIGLTPIQLAEQGKMTITDILVSDDRRQMSESFRENSSSPTFQHEYKLITPFNEEKQVIERGCKVFDETGNLIAIDGFITDISEKYHLTNELSRLERHDSLTGVYNRSQFEAVVQNVIYKAAYNCTEYVLLYVDLDQFKVVNDTCGHTAGDELLRQVTTILQSRLRRQDTLARLGGDEFGILLENCNIEEATRIANELCSSIESFRFKHKQKSIGLTASIGIASTNCGLSSLQQILTAAESAAYAAKEYGRNRTHIYHPEDDAVRQRNRETQWAIEIPEALSDGRMYLDWQKIVPVGDPATSKPWYEILIRMLDKKGNTILPEAFLPAAERYNLAVLIDTWVVKTLLSKLDQEPARYDEIDLCFVNLSGQSMGQQAFLGNISGLLSESSISASRLCFEITETAAMADKEQALRFMNRLQKMGCRFALDDFGSGLSSFGYLRDFPVEFLKIDGEFIRDINVDPVNRSIVSSINEIGHANGKRIIAEFVEDDLILETLEHLGVDFAQGYGIGKPVKLDEFPQSNEISCL